MWKRFPEVLSLDNTYSMNHFKLPLSQVTGQTCLGSLYNAAFGVIDNEKVEGFQFLWMRFEIWQSGHNIRIPDVAISDFDEQMKAAISDAFQWVGRFTWKHEEELLRCIQLYVIVTVMIGTPNRSAELKL
jgi:hypothetical protein